MFIKEIENSENLIKKEFLAGLAMTILILVVNVFSHNSVHPTIISNVGEILIYLCFILLDIIFSYKYLILKFKRTLCYFINKKAEILLKNFLITLAIAGIVLLNINMFL